MSGPRRFRAPAGNGAVLADPPFADVPRLIADNRRRLARPDVAVGGLPLPDLRALARREALELADRSRERERPDDVGRSLTLPAPTDSPLLLAGHQPELSHPGVWVKNFALHGLARRVGGVPLNLIVDTDTLKTPALRVLHLVGRGPKAFAESIPFDRSEGDEPYEHRRVHDRTLFDSFPNRVTAITDAWGFAPLVRDVWRPGSAHVGEAFTDMRVRRERAWGCRNRELRVSALSQTEAFRRFVWHVLNDLPRFREVYNAALREYRRANGLKSASHPAPDLAERGGFVEAPFWTEHAGPKRQRARWFVRTTGGNFEHRVGNFDATFSEPRDESAFLQRLPTYHVIRPRALTLTLFARVCLGDFFIHGIGGGKYDEVTDAIVRDYFGIDPPAYQVLSATLHLPLPGFGATADDVRRRERLVRDLRWNPQRHLSRAHADRPEVRALAAEKQRLAAAEPPREDRPARRAWFRALQAVTEQLRPFTGVSVANAASAVARLREEAESDAVLRRRDYSWVLFPEDTLRPFLQRFLDP